MVARTDLVSDPRVQADLALVRLGTSVFRRALAAVDDDDLDLPTLPGWTRRHLLAHVGYNARAVARLVEWAATGVENPMYSSPRARAEEIDTGSTQNPEALRNLCEHAAVDLDVRWRDLPDDRWDFTVVTAQGREVPVAETVWMRSREVWLHSVDLRTGARVADVPGEVLDRLLRDVVGTWDKRGDAPGLVLRADPTGASYVTGPRPDHPLLLGDVEDEKVRVSGGVADVVAWATGRAAAGPDRTYGLDWSRGRPAPAPRWL